jgi:hypothetical protein
MTGSRSRLPNARDDRLGRGEHPRLAVLASAAVALVVDAYAVAAAVIIYGAAITNDMSAALSRRVAESRRECHGASKPSSASLNGDGGSPGFVKTLTAR